MMTVNIRDGSNTRRADSIHVRDGGEIRTVARAFVNDGGNVREVFDYASTPEQTIAYSGTRSNVIIPPTAGRNEIYRLTAPTGFNSGVNIPAQVITVNFTTQTYTFTSATAQTAVIDNLAGGLSPMFSISGNEITYNGTQDLYVTDTDLSYEIVTNTIGLNDTSSVSLIRLAGADYPISLGYSSASLAVGARTRGSTRGNILFNGDATAPSNFILSNGDTFTIDFTAYNTGGTGTVTANLTSLQLLFADYTRVDTLTVNTNLTTTTSSSNVPVVVNSVASTSGDWTVVNNELVYTGSSDISWDAVYVERATGGSTQSGSAFGASTFFNGNRTSSNEITSFRTETATTGESFPMTLRNLFGTTTNTSQITEIRLFAPSRPERTTASYSLSLETSTAREYTLLPIGIEYSTTTGAIPENSWSIRTSASLTNAPVAAITTYGDIGDRDGTHYLHIRLDPGAFEGLEVGYTTGAGGLQFDGVFPVATFNNFAFEPISFLYNDGGSFVNAFFSFVGAVSAISDDNSTIVIKLGVLSNTATIALPASGTNTQQFLDGVPAEFTIEPTVFTNAVTGTFSPNIGATAALQEIATAVETAYPATAQTVTGNLLDINTGQERNLEGSITITENDGTDTGITINHSFTDGFPPVDANGVATTYTVTDYLNREITSFTSSVSADTETDIANVISQILTPINNAMNPESPTDFTATAENNVITLTSTEKERVAGRWAVTVNNNSQTTNPGNITFNTATIVREGRAYVIH